LINSISSMPSSISLSAALALLALLPFHTTAFELHLYGTKQCSGLATAENATVEAGCISGRGGSVQAIINKWVSEADNKLLLVTYSDANCCHFNTLETMSWTDGCAKLADGTQSWRVLDPNEPDKGKDGEMYSC
jgi:hypothetical protein